MIANNQDELRPIVTDLAKLIKESKTQYKVPFFQRGYVWRKDKWKKLLDNIRDEIFKKKIDEINEEEVKDNQHFFGSIVLKQDRGQDPPRREYIIIDGQQRLLTCYSILFCIYKSLVALESKDAQGHEKSDEIKKGFLVNEADSNNNYNELKFIAGQGDTLSLYRYLNNGENPVLPGDKLGREQFLLNEESIPPLFKYCESRLKKEYDTIEKLLKLKEAVLHSLTLVCIYLPDEFEEQIIFETLNADGEELRPSELLCNYIFNEIRKCNKKLDLGKLHYEKWLMPQRTLEKARQTNKQEYTEFESFLRFSSSIGHEKMLPKGRPIYYKFKEDFKRADTHKQLDILAEDINYFISYINPGQAKDFGNKMQNLGDTGIYSFIPFIISLLRAYKKEKVQKSIVDKLLDSTLSLSVRQKVVGKNPKYDVFFPRLWEEIKESSDLHMALKEEIKKKNWLTDDKEFIDCLINNRIYRDNDKKFCRYLLREIDRKIASDDHYEQKIDYSSFSEIEHTLPQSVLNNSSASASTRKWKEHLGGDINDPKFQEIVHSIGNLTLLGRGNSAVSNLFIDQKLEHKAYKEPRPPITKIIEDVYKRNKKWGVKSINERSELLAKTACEIWSWD